MKKILLLFVSVFCFGNNFAAIFFDVANSQDSRVLCIDWKKAYFDGKRTEYVCSSAADKAILLSNPFLMNRFFIDSRSLMPVYAVELNHDVDYMAIGTQLPCGKFGKRYVIQVLNLENLLNEYSYSGEDLIGHADLITSLSWAKDNAYLLASGSLDGTVKVWDAFLDKTLLSTFQFQETLNKKKPSVWCVQWSHNSEEKESNQGVCKTIKLAAGVTDGCINVWTLDIENKNHGEVKILDEISLKSNNGFVRSMDWSKDDRFIIAGYHDGSIRIWDVEKDGRKCIWRTKGHCGAVSGVSFFKDSSHFVSTGMDGKVKFWNLKNGENEIVEEFRCENGMFTQIHCAFLSPDNFSLLAGLTGEIAQVDLSSFLLLFDFENLSDTDKESSSSEETDVCSSSGSETEKED